MSSPAVTKPNQRRAAARWSIALVATAALVVSGSGLVVFAQSGAGESQGPQFVPADASVYVEARLDMPAGQDEALAQFMTAFPGFADAGAFDLKVDEFIAGLASEMGEAMPEGDLLGDIFTGEIGLAVADLEAAMMGGEPQLLIGVALADAAAAEAMVDELLAGSVGTEQDSYNDVDILTDTMSSPPMSLAMYEGWMLVGTGPETVAGAIDALDGTVESLAADPAFTAAWSRLPAARLGAAYVEFAPFGSLVDFATMMAASETGMALPEMDIAAMLPQDMVASLVADDDRLTLEVLLTPGEATPSLPVGESDLAASFPANTQIYLETRELGAAIESGLGQLEELMAAQAGSDASGEMSEIEVLFGEESPITAMLGVPLPEFLDFVGDAGVGAGFSSDGLWLGIAAEVDDPDAADDRLTSLLTVLRMFTLQMEEEGVSIETEMVGDVEVTSLVLPLDEVMAGQGIAIGDSIDFALDGERMFIGLGDFVSAAILADGTESLANSPGYLDAIGEDVPNSGVMYVNIGSLLAAFEPMLAMMGPDWEQIAPYATAFDRMVVVGTEQDELMRSRMTVIVDA